MPIDQVPRRIEMHDQHEVATVMRELSVSRECALPVGNASSLGRGAHTGQLGVLVSTRGMDGILRLDKGDLSCSVAAGTSFEAFL